MGCAAGRDEIISDSYHDQFAARHGAGELLAGRESGNAPVVRLGESALAPGIPISDRSRSGNWVRSTNSYMQRNWLNAGSFAMPVPQRRHLFRRVRGRYFICFSLWPGPPTGRAMLCNDSAPVFQGGRCARVGQFAKACVGMLTSGGRLHAVGGRRSWPRLADAFRSDGEGMVQFGGSGT